jgi:hypothetical protein
MSNKPIFCNIVSVQDRLARQWMHSGTGDSVPIIIVVSQSSSLNPSVSKSQQTEGPPINIAIVP